MPCGPGSSRTSPVPASLRPVATRVRCFALPATTSSWSRWRTGSGAEPESGTRGHSRPAILHTALSVQRVAEIVIAGAGMAGIAVAYQLAVRARAAGVVLVDPREPLSLTSRMGTEAYRNYWPGPDAAMGRLMDRSIDLLDEIDRESGHAFELNRRGYVYLTADPNEAGRLRAEAGDVGDFAAE